MDTKLPKKVHSVLSTIILPLSVWIIWWIFYILFSAVGTLRVGSSLSPVMMTGTTFRREGIVPPRRKVYIFGRLSAADLVKQTALASFGAVSLFGFKQSGFTQIVERTADGGVGELQFSGDGGDGWPALTVLVGTIGEVDIHRDCPVGQVTAIEEVKSAQWTAPPVSSRGRFVCWAARDA